jgi:hypothetical protein
MPSCNGRSHCSAASPAFEQNQTRVGNRISASLGYRSVASKNFGCQIMRYRKEKDLEQRLPRRRCRRSERPLGCSLGQFSSSASQASPFPSKLGAASRTQTPPEGIEPKALRGILAPCSHAGKSCSPLVGVVAAHDCGSEVLRSFLTATAIMLRFFTALPFRKCPHTRASSLSRSKRE